MLHIRLCVFIILILITADLCGQWDQYEATWDNEPGVMSVNLDIKRLAPIEELAFLLEITQDAIDCNDDGLIVGDELRATEKIATDIDSILSTAMYVEDVGRLLYRCKVKDYIYIQDSTVTDQVLEALYGLSLNYKILNDKSWRVYQEFIYPDDFLIQTMINKRIFNQLHEEQFDFEEKALLYHYASFVSDEDRNDFRRFLIQNNYKIGKMTDHLEKALPYIISFNRKDKLHLERLSNITLRLHQKSKSLEGSYDGWEIEIGS